MPVVFSVDQDVWPDIEQFSPTTIVIFRHQNNAAYTGGQDGPGDAYKGDPVQSAITWTNANMPTWKLNHAQYYAPINEQDPGTLPNAKWLNTFTLKCMEIAEANGFKLALYAFSGGNPKDVDKPTEGDPFTLEDVWTELLPSMQHAKANGHILLLHEYGFNSPELHDDEDNLIAPATSLRASAPNLALRYRRSMKFLFEHNADVPVVISEASAGVGFVSNGFGVPSWLADVKWYDSELMRDRAVIGCGLYQLGGAENLMDALPFLAAYVKVTKTPAPESGEYPVVGCGDPDGDSGGDEVPPAKPRGAPRAQYARTYILFSPKTNPRTNPLLISRILDVTSPFSPSFGSSADDAGIGDLDLRTVLAIRPSEWPLTQAWFDENYPGVKMVAFEGSDNEVLAAIASRYNKVVDPIKPQTPVIKVADKFGSPVGTEMERLTFNGTAWPGQWYDATGFAQRYQLPGTTTYAVHTGADLNLPNNADAKQPVYAPANGVITVAGDYPVWGNIVVIKHKLPDGSLRWSRLAHLETLTVRVNDIVEIGQQVGTIGDAHEIGRAHV